VRADPESLHIRHSAGVSKVAYEDLTDAQRRSYNLTVEGVNAYRKTLQEQAEFQAIVDYETAVVREAADERERKIKSGYIFMGMTRDEARRAWGSPRDINRTVFSGGVHEQWVYGDEYLYFEDGVLTSWQD
jgi:hypothetical protein